MKAIMIFSMVIIMFTSCQKALIGSATSNTPVNNFESMWKGYDELYGMFTVKSINWDSLHDVWKPQVTANTSNQQLYTVLSGMIKPLNDIHVFLQPTSDGLQRYESTEIFRMHTTQHDLSIDVI